MKTTLNFETKYLIKLIIIWFTGYDKKILTKRQKIFNYKTSLKM